MPGEILVFVLTLSGQSEDASVGAMAQATREALGDTSRVVVEPRAVMPADGEAAALSESARATALAEIVWNTPQHDRVHVRLHVTGSPAWIDRDIVFTARDDVAERGRTIGLALGATIQPVVAMSAPESLPPPPVTPAPLAPSSPSVAPPPPPPRPPLTHREAERRPLRPLPPVTAAPRFVLGAAAEWAGAIAGDGGGWGGSVLAGWSPAPSVNLHVTSLVRLGEVQSVGARALTVAFGGGATWYPWLRSSYAIGARLDVLGLYDNLARPEPSGVAHRTRWAPALRPTLEWEWRFTAQAALAVGIGIEAVLGESALLVGNEQAATLAPLRGTGELGLRIRF